MRISTMSLLATMALAGCAVQVSAPVDNSKNRVVDIVNTTGAELGFYAVNAGRRGIFRAQFSPAPLGKNDYMTINFVDGSGACLFDLHANFSDGRSALAKGFDTCAAAAWVITAEMAQ